MALVLWIKFSAYQLQIQVEIWKTTTLIKYVYAHIFKCFKVQAYLPIALMNKELKA